MRKVVPRVLSIIKTTLLVVALGAAGLWIWSYFQPGGISRERWNQSAGLAESDSSMAGYSSGRIIIGTRHLQYTGRALGLGQSTAAQSTRAGWKFDDTRPWRDEKEWPSSFWPIRWDFSSATPPIARQLRFVSFPCWLVVLVAGAWPATGLIRRTSRMRLPWFMIVTLAILLFLACWPMCASISTPSAAAIHDLVLFKRKVPDYWPIILYGFPVLTALVVLFRRRRRLSTIALTSALLAAMHAGLWNWGTRQYVKIHLNHARDLPADPDPGNHCVETYDCELGFNQHRLQFSRWVTGYAPGNGPAGYPPSPELNVYARAPVSGPLRTYFPGMSYDNWWLRYGFQFANYATEVPRKRMWLYDRMFLLTLPHWAVMTLLLIFPAIWTGRRIRRARRKITRLISSDPAAISAPVAIVQSADAPSQPTPPAADAPPMHCRRCYYDLRGLPRNCCPECGRPFDPTKPRTYRTHPPRLKRTLLRLSVSMCALALLSAATFYTWLHFWREAKIAGYAKEKAAIKTIEAGGGEVNGFVIDAPPWLAKRLGNPRYLQRATMVHLPCFSTASANVQLAPLHNLPRLETLTITGDKRIQVLDDPVIEHLRSFTELRSLSLESISITAQRLRRLNLATLPHFEAFSFTGSLGDPALAELSNLHSLKRLTLVSTQISSSGINKYLHDMTQLQEINLDENPNVDDSIAGWLGTQSNLRKAKLSNTLVGDNSVSELARIPYLKDLDLSGGTRIHDVSVWELTAMPSLSVLSVDQVVSDKGLTINGQQKLRNGRPNLSILSVASPSTTRPSSRATSLPTRSPITR